MREARCLHISDLHYGGGRAPRIVYHTVRDQVASDVEAVCELHNTATDRGDHKRYGEGKAGVR